MKRFALVLLVCLASCKETPPAEPSTAAAPQPSRPALSQPPAQPAPGPLAARLQAGLPVTGADLVPEMAPRLKAAAEQLSTERLARFLAFERTLGKSALGPFFDKTPENEAAREKSGMSWDELRDLTLLTGDYYPTLRIVREGEANLADLRARAKSSKEAAGELEIMEPIYRRQAAKIERQKELYGEKAIAVLDAAAGQYFELQDEVFGPVR